MSGLIAKALSVALCLLYELTRLKPQRDSNTQMLSLVQLNCYFYSGGLTTSAGGEPE